MKKEHMQKLIAKPAQTQKQQIAQLRRELKEAEKKIDKLIKENKTMQVAFEESIIEIQRVVTDESLEAVLNRVDRRIRQSKRANRSGGKKLRHPSNKGDA